MESSNGWPQLHVALRWRIVGLLLLTSLLPLALVGVGAWVVFGGLLVDRTLEQQRGAVRSHAAAIDLYLGERLRALELVARSHGPEELTGEGRLEQLFSEVSASYPRSFVDLGVIDVQGRHLAYVGPYALKDKTYADSPWFKTVLTEGAFVSDVFRGHRLLPHLVIAVLRNHDGRKWILRATINSEAFHSMVRPTQLGRTGDAFIVNVAGLYQTPPRQGQVLTPSPLKPRPHQGVQDQRIRVGDRSLVQVTTWLNDGRWMLVVRQDEAEIRAPVHQAAGWGALVASIAVVLAALVTIISTVHLTNRIDRVTAERDQFHRDLMRSGKLASLGELATGLAHEINNPLAIISAEQTNISDQLDDLEMSAEARQGLTSSVARCRRQIDRCSGITNKMLQFGRSTDARPRLMGIAPLITEVVELMRRQASIRNIELGLDLDHDSPQVVVDGSELEQVLINLIKNGMDAITGRGRITVRVRPVDQQLQLSVSDSGAGISPEDLDRVFQPFFTTKPVGQGTGMGLAVCYGIVRSWGGSITAESKPGHGTTMTIRIPIPGGRQG